MKTVLSPPGPATGTARDVATTRVVEEAVAFVRLVHALKSQQGSRSAHSLLFVLGPCPMRVTALAEAVHADPSTISRQVAELVRADLVRREADPADGRASRLVLTPAGHEALQALRRQRTAWMAGTLADWSVEEVNAFADSFSRFTRGLTESLAPSSTPATATESS